MFDDEEYRELRKVYLQCVENIKEYRKSFNVPLNEVPKNSLYQPLFALYKEFSGTEAEFDAEELMQRHYLSRWKEYKEL